MTKQQIKELTEKVGRKFRSFGGGHGQSGNPLAEALKDGPLQFAAGVDIKSVVIFMIEEKERIHLFNLEILERALRNCLAVCRALKTIVKIQSEFPLPELDEIIREGEKALNDIR